MLVAEQAGDGSWLFDGGIDTRSDSIMTEVDLINEADRYLTVAGHLLRRLGYPPQEDEKSAAAGLW